LRAVVGATIGSGIRGGAGVSVAQFGASTVVTAGADRWAVEYRGPWNSPGAAADGCAGVGGTNAAGGVAALDPVTESGVN